MSDESAIPASSQGLTHDQRIILTAVKAHCERLLDHSPRFKYFTLHGKEHLNGLFEILALVRKGGVELERDQLFVLSIAICIHDLGMVVPLRDKEIREILDGRPGFPDATALENFVRERHHDLLEIYLENEVGFLLNLGLTPVQIAVARDISRCHRKLVLQEQNGMIRDLGALLRVIDELDIGSARAPADVFLNICDSMDTTSIWHWFKHNICDPWVEGHTVTFLTENNRKRIVFTIVVRPTREKSINYWLTQIRRPIGKALLDDNAQTIIRERFGVTIEIKTSPESSQVNSLNTVWQKLEETALSSNRKVIMVIDDEVRRMEDLFLPLTDDFHVIYAFNAKDAISKLDAGIVDLAIVDIQIGSGGVWKDVETEDFKMTGVNICKHILENYPKTQIAVLTATRYSVMGLPVSELAFNLRKPIDPDELVEKVRNAVKR
jgi:CheY-like chemotaxis protein